MCTQLDNNNNNSILFDTHKNNYGICYGSSTCVSQDLLEKQSDTVELIKDTFKTSIFVQNSSVIVSL